MLLGQDFYGLLKVFARTSSTEELRAGLGSHLGFTTPRESTLSRFLSSRRQNFANTSVYIPAFPSRFSMVCGKGEQEAPQLSRTLINNPEQRRETTP